MNKSRDTRVRAFGLAVDAIRFAREVVRRDPVLRRLAFQLVDAAGSVGANLEEAVEAQSKKDFVAKNCIAAKEARESRYWLRLLVAVEPALATAANSLIAESSEIVAMLVATIKTARSNPYRGRS